MANRSTEEFQEPHLSEFRRLVRLGAGTLDIHDGQTGSPYTREALADERLVQREVDRVRIHRNSICRLLEQQLGAIDRVLDLVCGTGATTVAVAMSARLATQEVVGVDPNESSLRAASVRAAGYGLGAPRVRFQAITPGTPLPFPDNAFGLTLCVSVIEYLGKHAAREALAREMLRVTRPGSHVCLVTPNPFRLFDYHTHRLLGDLRRTEGFPWASRPGEIRRMFAPHDTYFLRREQIQLGLKTRGVPGAGALGRLSWLATLLPWQKVIVRKNA